MIVDQRLKNFIFFKLIRLWTKTYIMIMKLNWYSHCNIIHWIHWRNKWSLRIWYFTQYMRVKRVQRCRNWDLRKWNYTRFSKSWNSRYKRHSDCVYSKQNIIKNMKINVFILRKAHLIKQHDYNTLKKFCFEIWLH